MTYSLETAAHPETLRRVAIDPVSRVEGHGKVTILLDDQNKVHQVRLHIVEFRGFEKFIQGRPYWEVPVMVQRLCGICPVSHHLAASKALDVIVGARKLTPAAEKAPPPDALRPDVAVACIALLPPLFARPAVRFRQRRDPAQHRRRGCMEHPETAKRGVLLRKLRPGGDPRHGRQAGAWHRRSAGRRQQVADHCRARRTAQGYLPHRCNGRAMRCI
jgi:NAD-reducing hydrogenase large subunit